MGRINYLLSQYAYALLCGDTGYSDIFKLIYLEYNPIDVSILPIGSYEPISLFNHSHLTPFESVEIHQILKSRQSLASHWGTFKRSEASLYSPLKDLRTAKELLNVRDDEFIHLQPGTQFNIQLPLSD